MTHDDEMIRNVLGAYTTRHLPCDTFSPEPNMGAAYCVHCAWSQSAHADHDWLKALVAERDRLRAAVALGIEALPDGERYRFVWDECQSDEQEYVKDVRAKLNAALEERQPQ